MAKTITFNNGTQDVTLTVEDVFPSREDGQNVLKVIIAEKNHTYDDVCELKKCTSDIVYTVDGEVKAEYKGYTCGDDGFKLRYDSTKTFYIGICQHSAIDDRVDDLDHEHADSILVLIEAILDLSLEIEELMKGV